MAARTHGVLMDSVYRRQRHVYDFTRKYYLFGRDRLIDGLKLGDNERLLEIGCGTARNLIRIARRHPAAHLYGIDISSEMLKTANASIAHAGLDGRIALAQAPAEKLCSSLFDGKPFEHVLFSYSLSMIPQWKQALSAAARAAPNGRIHIVDFGDLTGLGGAGSFILKTWLGLFHVSPRKELLHAFESALPALRGSANLRVLPGRYAFLVSCDSEQIANMAARDVAP